MLIKYLVFSDLFLYGHRSCKVFELFHGRFWSAIWKEHAVANKVAVMFLLAVISTVGASLGAIWKSLIKSVIPHLPDKSTLQTF